MLEVHGLSRGFLALAAVAIFQTVGAHQASALTQLNGSCPNYTINDHVELIGNLVQTTNDDCITIAGGKDVHLGSYQIICSAAQCDTAIKATASGTDVASWAHVGAGIYGPWDVGVEGATTIQTITVDGSLVAVLDNGDRLKTIFSTYFYCDGPSFCVDVVMPRGTDEISAMTMQAAGSGLRIVGASSGNGPTVLSNGISGYTGTGIEQVGSTKKVRVIANGLTDCSGTPGCTTPVPFVVANSALATDPDVWRSNGCSDDYYCPPQPTCANGGYPICWGAGVLCTP